MPLNTDLIPGPAHTAQRLGLTYLPSIADEALDYELVRDLPISYLRQHEVLPIRHNGGLVVAVSDARRLEVADEIRLLLSAPSASVALAEAETILGAIDRTFDRAEGRDEELMQGLAEDDRLFNELEHGVSEDLLEDQSDAPIIKLVNHILSQAVKANASDIHIEPYRANLSVRFRLDGVLHTIHTLPRKLHAPVISRLKIMAKLNIAEKRLPQDGRIEIKIGSRQVDLRVSSLPTAFGERMVMRLLEKSDKLLSLEEIGLETSNLAEMRRLMRLSHGIILVTGPTGSGKTTTLYAALSEINSPDKNILTIEDPVEYQLDGIGQMQVNSKIDLTFAKGLRSMVRQDPDVILVGEIRDRETAEIAIQASLTGHLVFSTLHTNDAPSAITRLIDIGIEPFLVSSAVRAIIAQRLVRRLCTACRKPDVLTDAELTELNMQPGSKVEVFRQGGCDVCMGTGYKGRTAIYEFARMTDKLQDLVVHTSDANQVRKLALEEGMISLREDGMRKALAGVTSPDEVLRVTLL